jgi:DNA-binding MarR family transcriptional regulator
MIESYIFDSTTRRAHHQPLYCRFMDPSEDARLVNLVGAMATGLVDRMNAACADVTRVSGAAAEALVVLLDFSPDASVHALSQAVGLTHSGGVRLVDRLEGAGWVRRRPGEDARSVKIRLTRRGRSVAERVRSRRSAEIASAIEGLTANQRADLLRSCEVVVSNLTRDRLEQRASGGLPAGGALCRLCDFTSCGRPEGRCPAANTAADAHAGR